MLQYSVEGVNNQSDTDFFDSLVEEIRRIKYSEVKIEDSQLINIIKFRMNIADLKMYYVDDSAYYAGVNIPALSLNHIHETVEKAYRELDVNALMKGLRLSGKQSNAYVDRETGRLGGIYSNFPLELQMSRGLFEHKKATPEIIAATLLHEMGHVFSYFETLHSTISTNLVIHSAMEEIVGQKEGMMKIKVVNRLVDEGVLPETMDTSQVDELNNDHLHQLLLTTAMQETVYRNDSPLYDMTMCEQQADAFVVRMGGGRYLAESIKLFQMELGGEGSKPNNWFIQLLAFMTKSVLFMGPVYWITAWALHRMQAKMDTYGSVKTRLEHIKREAIHRLKVVKSKRLENQLVKDIDSIEKVLKEAYDDRTYLQKFFTFVTPFLRRQNNKKEQQLVIEELMSNDLFYTAAKLKQFGRD